MAKAGHDVVRLRIRGSMNGGSTLYMTPAGGAVVGVSANGGDQYDDYCFFARVSGLRPWLTSHMPGLRFGVVWGDSTRSSSNVCISAGAAPPKQHA